jgi:hypothetical protein
MFHRPPASAGGYSYLSTSWIILFTNYDLINVHKGQLLFKGRVPIAIGRGRVKKKKKWKNWTFEIPSLVEQ